MKRLLIAMAIVLLSPVCFAEDSYAIVEYPAPDPTELIPYIYQGDTVCINDTIDISGVAPPYNFLAYWDGFDMYDHAPTYNLTLPDSKKGYYKFWLDPSVFGGRTGWWYKYDGEYEQQGNNRAFRVSANCTDVATVNQSNVTHLNQTPHVVTPAPMLPERHVADYVVAKGDPLRLPDGVYSAWILGRVDAIYFTSQHTISAERMEALEAGSYKIVMQYPGNNTIYDYGYDSFTHELVPGLYGKEIINVHGFQPSVVHGRLKQALAGTDDILQEYTLDYQNPYITINQADEQEFNGITSLNVRGYSNVAENVSINVSLDEKNAYYKDIAKRFSYTKAVRTNPGNLSYYSVNVPVDYDELAADARNHTLTARTALGGIAQKDFKISVMPSDSYRPNASLKYIEDRNPFVPTPTPLVITQVVTKVVEVTVTIPVTPSNEQVYAQQKKAQDDVAYEYAVKFGYAVLALVAAYLAWRGFKWVLSVYRRL